MRQAGSQRRAPAGGVLTGQCEVGKWSKKPIGKLRDGWPVWRWSSSTVGEVLTEGDANACCSILAGDGALHEGGYDAKHRALAAAASILPLADAICLAVERVLHKTVFARAGVWLAGRVREAKVDNSGTVNPDKIVVSNGELAADPDLTVARDAGKEVQGGCNLNLRDKAGYCRRWVEGGARTSSAVEADLLWREEELNRPAGDGGGR